MLLSLFACVAIASVVASQGSTPRTCVRRCETLELAYRPDCDDCTKFHLCAGGNTFNFSCPATLYYDSVRLLCDRPQFVTCGVGEPNALPATEPSVQSAGQNQGGQPAGSRGAHACVASCDGMPDGDYHSCRGCEVYASCTAGMLTDSRLCPWSTSWDDVMKQCILDSTTCQASRSRRSAISRRRRQAATEETPAGLPNDGGQPEAQDFVYNRAMCIRSCEGLPPGLYNVCKDCGLLGYCFFGIPKFIPCGGGLEYDAKLRNCVPRSSTCMGADIAS